MVKSSLTSEGSALIEHDSKLPNARLDLLHRPDPTRLVRPLSTHAPRIPLLYGSLRERSYSRFLREEAARLLEFSGAETCGDPIQTIQRHCLAGLRKKAGDAACISRGHSGSRVSVEKRFLAARQPTNLTNGTSHRRWGYLVGRPVDQDGSSSWARSAASPNLAETVT
jgi:hypothetical protein